MMSNAVAGSRPASAGAAVDLGDAGADPGGRLDLGQFVRPRPPARVEAPEPKPARVDHEVAGERLVDGGVDRGLGRGGEDRDEADQADADHQRRGGGRRALGVAHGVLAGERAPLIPQAGSGPAEDAAQRQGDGAARARTRRRRPAAHPAPTSGSGLSPPPNRPSRAATRPSASSDAADDDAQLRPVAGAADGDVAHGGDRRDLARLAGRRERGDDRDDDTRRPARRPRCGW